MLNLGGPYFVGGEGAQEALDRISWLRLTLLLESTRHQSTVPSKAELVWKFNRAF